MSRIDKTERRLRRKRSIRNTIYGTRSCPRMTVYRSNKHLSMQVIDDDKQHTLLSITSMQKDFSHMTVSTKTAAVLGEKMGKKLKEKKIKKIVFDRNGYFYHGVIRAFADAVRKEGIQF